MTLTILWNNYKEVQRRKTGSYNYSPCEYKHTYMFFNSNHTYHCFIDDFVSWLEQSYEIIIKKYRGEKIGSYNYSPCDFFFTQMNLIYIARACTKYTVFCLLLVTSHLQWVHAFVNVVFWHVHDMCPSICRNFCPNWIGWRIKLLKLKRKERIFSPLDTSLILSGWRHL